MNIRLAFAALSPFLFGQVSAQENSVQTSVGPLIIQPIQHATLVLSANGKNIYVDPEGGAEAFKNSKAPDLILVTDIHGDHFDEKTIDAVKKAGTVIVVPKAVADQMKGDKKGVVILNNGENTKQKGFQISAIPMYNLPETPDSKHTKGRGNGYVINIGGKNIYISGDTEDIPEMRALKNIDVAFVCMNLPYTMDINQAASAVLEFKPKIVYPYHYRGSDGLADVAAFKKMVNEKDPAIEVRLADWYGSK
jgi:L-ascorbate metabolism protein UlaG (beta-lactamase superfamily)